MAVPVDEKRINGIPKGEVCILAGVLLVAFLLRMAFLHEPFERDEGLYGYIGQEILRGAIPYRDIADIKPPGSFYLYAGMVTFFGNTLEGIRVATGIYSLFTTYFVFRVARYLHSSAAGFFAAGIFAVFSAAPLVQGSSSNTEVFMLLPLVISVYSFLRGADTGRRSLFAWSGFFAGCAVMIKTVAAPYAALVFLFVLFRPGLRNWQERIKDVGAFLAPPVATALLTLSYFAAYGALSDLFYWNVTIHKRYVQTGKPIFFPAMKAGLDFLRDEQLFLWGIGLGGGIWYLASRRNLRAALIMALLPISALSVALPGHFYPHYFIQLTPFCAIPAGLALGAAWHRRGVIGAFLLVISVAGIFLHFKADYPFYVNYTPNEVTTYKYGETTFADSVRVADYVKAKTQPEDYVVQWGFEPEIYFYSNRRGLKNLATFLGVAWAPRPAEAVMQMLAEIESKRPKYIIVQDGGNYTLSSGFRQLADVIEKDYYLEHRQDYALIFRRK